MQKLLRYSISAVLLLAILIISGYEKENKAAAAPFATKELLVCSSMGENFTTRLVDDFAKRTGVRVKVAYLPAGSFSERMDFLRANKFDCWWGGTAEEYYLAEQQNMLEPYKAIEAHKIPPQMRNNQGHWTSLYLEYIAFISNKPKLRDNGVYAPDTWKELLLPQFKNEIVIPDFVNGGASYGMLTSIWQLNGKAEALAYAGRLNAQNITYTANAADAVDMVYRGEKMVAVVPLKQALLLEAKHKHLFATVVKDANRNLLTCAAVLQAGANKEQAKQFIDYLLSDASHDLIAEKGYVYIWHVKNYPYNDGRKELIGNVQVPADDLSWTAVEKNEIIRQWLKAW